MNTSPIFVTKSFNRFYPNATDEIKERLAYELSVVKSTQFANYFLVVWDIVSFVRQETSCSACAAAPRPVLFCIVWGSPNWIDGT